MKIKDVNRVKTGSYAQGSSFSKGDYITTETSYMANDDIELDAGKIRDHLGMSRISDKSLDRLAGLDTDMFEKE